MGLCFNFPNRNHSGRGGRIGGNTGFASEKKASKTTPVPEKKSAEANRNKGLANLREYKENHGKSEMAYACCGQETKWEIPNYTMHSATRMKEHQDENHLGFLRAQYQEIGTFFRTVWDFYLKFYIAFMTLNFTALGLVIQYMDPKHRGPVVISFVVQNLLAAATAIGVAALFKTCGFATAGCFKHFVGS